MDVLPVELLQYIFDFLSAEDRKSASPVCHHWRQVLWSNRYVKRMTAKVNSRTLNSQWALQRMQRPFRKVTIEEDFNQNLPAHNSYLTRVRKLMSSEVIRCNVQELRFVLCLRSFNRIFGQQVVCYPKLKKLSYLPGTWRIRIYEDIALPFNVDAPQLRILDIDLTTESTIELIRRASRQIESLSMRFYDKASFLKVLDIDSFASLREATFMAIVEDSEVLLPDELNATHRLNFTKLDTLKITDNAYMFFHVYDIIFQAAIDLSELHVVGKDMPSSALALIPSMKKLHRLILYVYASNG